MLLSSLNSPNYKYSQRNIQSSYSRNFYEKTFVNKMKYYLKNAKLTKSTENKRNNSQNQILFNSADKNKINNLTTKKGSGYKNISIQKGISNLFNSDKVYSNIMEKMEKIMVSYRNNKIKLYYLLNKIDNFINNIFKENNSNNNKASLKDNKSYTNLNIAYKEDFEVKKKEMEDNIYKKKINKLIQKINDIETKFKTERLSYLFCIGENQKKISELERKLKMNSIDKMTKEELRKFICYPNYVKFEVKDEINPKSIPMYSSKRYEAQSPKVFRKIEPLFETELKNARNSINSYSSFYNSEKKNDINNENEFDNNEEDTEKQEDQKEIDKIIEPKEFNDIIELGSKNFEKHFSSLNKFSLKNKNYFISHPKLDYIKEITSGNKITNWKLGNQIGSLPKQLSKLKTVSKSQKNAIVVFPSFLNETLLNIEKLKTSKNFRSIEHKFEDTYKIKLKSND